MLAPCTRGSARPRYPARSAPGLAGTPALALPVPLRAALRAALCPPLFMARRRLSTIRTGKMAGSREESE